jgi:hypothetical protein
LPRIPRATILHSVKAIKHAVVKKGTTTVTTYAYYLEASTPGPHGGCGQRNAVLLVSTDGPSELSGVWYSTYPREVWRASFRGKPFGKTWRTPRSSDHPNTFNLTLAEAGKEYPYDVKGSTNNPQLADGTEAVEMSLCAPQTAP